MASLNVETLTAPAIAEPTTPMKPSEALRLGRLLRPRRLTDGSATDGCDGACAIASIWAAGYPFDHASLYTIAALCPGKVRWWFWSRNCGRPPYAASSIVIHLNDDHKWSDDQIVAWLQDLGL